MHQKVDEDDHNFDRSTMSASSDGDTRRISTLGKISWYLTITCESQIGTLLRLMEELSQKIYAN